MSDSSIGSAAPPSGSEPDSPSFAELAADPEIAPLLEFTPVPRSHAKANGWSPDMQRMFIAWLAYYGSPTNACDELNKARSGIDKVYKSPDADEFRAAWDGAVALAERRRIAALASRPGGAGVLRGPSISRANPHAINDLRAGDESGDECEIDEEEKLRLLEHIAGKFMKKVAAERRCRLGGEIVAADFYLRQITMLEVLFDLTSSHFGWNPRELLRNLRRGGHSLVEIVSTPFADWLDIARREWWAAEGDPERPPHPDPRFTELRHEGPWGSRGSDGYSLAIDQHAYGAQTPPATGYSEDEWRGMSHDQQYAARQLQFDVDAEEQAEWERRAHEAWEASEHGARAHAEWEAREPGGPAND